MKHLVSGMLLGLAMVAAAQATHDPAPAENGMFGRLRTEWARNLHDKHIDASVAEFDADAEFIDPGGNRVRGTAALRQLFTMITATYDSDLTFSSVRVEVSGDLAYDSGTYTENLVLRASGKHQKSSGSYLTEYKRGKDGQWLIVEQVWTGTVYDASLVRGSATRPT